MKLQTAKMIKIKLGLWVGNSQSPSSPFSGLPCKGNCKLQLAKRKMHGDNAWGLHNYEVQINNRWSSRIASHLDVQVVQRAGVLCDV